MKNNLVLLIVSVMGCIIIACEPQVTSTCSDCEFYEFEYRESISVISGFDTTKLLIEQPYPDWELQDSIETPAITYSHQTAPDSTVVLRLTVDAGAGSEDARAQSQIGYDGEKFRIWYGSASRRYFKSKAVADSPRPPYFRIKEIEVLTPYQKDAVVDFNVKFPSK